MAQETLITCHDVFGQLCGLPSMTPEKARQLLDPTDKQNVPKAVNLLQSLIMLKEHAQASALPSHAHRRDVLSFLSKTLGFFLLPFISINMSLSEQVRSLTTYAHLIAALWTRHRTKFMTGALYADSQAIVKNIVITVARLQLVDNDLPFHIILEGMDRLEGLFGDCRTQDHSRNFDVQQLAEKLATSTLIQGIFERNPDLDSGHRRLSLKDAMGVDHVNPRSWNASVRVGDVELAAEWARGRADANELLKSCFGPSACMDFDIAFPAGGDRDLLRPLGDYVGCNYDPDDLRTEAAETGSVFDRGSASTSAATDGVESAPDSEGSDDDGGFDDEPEGTGLDDFLPRRTGRLPTVADFPDDHFLEVDGRKYLKASVVTIFLTAKRSRKVTMRILRARGVTLEDLRGNAHDRFNGNDLDGTDLVKCGDIAATLIRVGAVICLAVVEVLEIHIEGDKMQRVTAVELEEMEADDAHVKVLVQVLKMNRQQGRSDESDMEWLWDHHYAEFHSDKNSPQAKASQYILSVPGPLLFPLGPSIVPVVPRSEPSSTRQSLQSQAGQSPAVDVRAGGLAEGGSGAGPRTMSAAAGPETQPGAGAGTQTGVGPEDQTCSTTPITWSLSDTQLCETLDAAWNALKPDTDEILSNVELLPSAAKSTSMPYRDAEGERTYIPGR